MSLRKRNLSPSCRFNIYASIPLIHSFYETKKADIGLQYLKL